MHSGKQTGWSGEIVPPAPAANPPVPDPDESAPGDTASDEAWLPQERHGSHDTDPLIDTDPRGGLHKFDLGTVPASVTPPRSSRYAAWFAVVSSAATLSGLMFATAAVMGSSPTYQMIDLPNVPRGGEYPPLPTGGFDVDGFTPDRSERDASDTETPETGDSGAEDSGRRPDATQGLLRPPSTTQQRPPTEETEVTDVLPGFPPLPGLDTDPAKPSDPPVTPPTTEPTEPTEPEEPAEPTEPGEIGGEPDTGGTEPGGSGGEPGGTEPETSPPPPEPPTGNRPPEETETSELPQISAMGILPNWSAVRECTDRYFGHIVAGDLRAAFEMTAGQLRKEGFAAYAARYSNAASIEVLDTTARLDSTVTTLRITRKDGTVLTQQRRLEFTEGSDPLVVSDELVSK